MVTAQSTFHLSLESIFGVTSALLLAYSIQSFVTELAVEDGAERGAWLLALSFVSGLVYSLIAWLRALCSEEVRALRREAQARRHYRRGDRASCCRLCK